MNFTYPIMHAMEKAAISLPSFSELIGPIKEREEYFEKQYTVSTAALLIYMHNALGANQNQTGTDKTMPQEPSTIKAPTVSKKKPPVIRRRNIERYRKKSDKLECISEFSIKKQTKIIRHVYTNYIGLEVACSNITCNEKFKNLAGLKAHAIQKHPGEWHHYSELPSEL